MISLVLIPVQGTEFQTENQLKVENYKFSEKNYSNTYSSSCSVFTVEYNGSVFFANNEDEGGSRQNSRIWFHPPLDSSTYGCAYVGFYDNLPGGDDVDNLAIGGMNTQGLCFDANGIPLGFVDDTNDGLRRNGIHDWEMILRECASVEEVIQWHQTHNMGGYWGNQIHWADSSGDAVVIGPKSGGALAFTRKTSDYFISTNFNLASYNISDPTTSYLCERYRTMQTLLDIHLENDDLTLEKMRDILETVHFQRTSEYLGTVYSNIFDLTNRDIYLYILGDYEEVFKLNLDEELEKGAHEFRITLDGDFTTRSTIGFELLFSLFSLVILLRFYKRKV